MLPPDIQTRPAPAAPQFLTPVPQRGYVWWYVDAVSDDQRYGLTIIGFIGSVFSPYYALARRRGRTDPTQHCAMNVVLYGASGHRWAMTERNSSAMRRDARTFTVGPSSMQWDDNGLTVNIDEITNPLPSRLRGVVRLRPQALGSTAFVLDANGRHTWQPIAPLARVELTLEKPALRWSGSGYFDTNAGSEPIEDGFATWDWSRSVEPDGTRMFYDCIRRDGSPYNLAVRIGPDGAPHAIASPPRAKLSTTAWGIARATRSENPSDARVVETLENTPFYARSTVQGRIGGELVTSMHESLNLNRFKSPIVQAMLPFRMPRRGGT
jgi:carotenoid 1,2-hydratase